METIIQNIQRLQETKEAIKQALTNRGVSVSNSDTFYSYAEKIAAISSGKYEKANLNILDNIGNPVTEATVDIYYWDNKVESFTSTGATLTIYIPQYVYYTIKISHKTYKYNNITYIAIDGNTRDINSIGALNGVYIYDNTNNLTISTEWDTNNNNNAVGVAVISNKCKFVIDKSNVYDNFWVNAIDIDIPDLTNYTSWESASSKDFDGNSNTTKIIKAYGSGNATAADYCRSKSITVDGVARYGYLPSAAEIQIAYNNKKEVDTALSKINGKAMSTSKYSWTSTEYDLEKAWLLNWSDGSTKTNYKFEAGFFHIRPFYII